MCGLWHHTTAQTTESFMQVIDPNLVNMFQADKGDNIFNIGKYIYLVNGFVKNDDGDRKQDIFKIDADTREIVKRIAMEGPQGDIAIADRGGYWVTSDGFILLTGEWRNYSAGRMCTFLAKLNQDLETVWINYYPDLTTTYLYGEGVAETEEGYYLLYTGEGLDAFPHAKGEITIIKTDTAGAVLFNKMLTDTFAQTVGYGDITPTDDGNFLVSSVVRDYYYHPVLGTYTLNAIVHKIDRDAHQIWSKTMGYAKFPLQESMSTALAGGGGAVMWMKDTITTDPAVAWNFPLLYGLDQDGQRTWTHEWNQWPYSTVYRIKEASNGDILGVGFYKAGGQSKGKGWLFRLTSTGEPIWERQYSDSLLRPWSPHLELLDLCELADGRIAATGIVFDTTTTNYFNINVVLLVVDANGCLEPGCAEGNQYITSTLEPVYQRPDLPILRVSPTPATGPMTVAWPEKLESGNQAYELRCYDLQGRFVQQFNWPKGTSVLEIGTDKWKNGAYRLLLFVQNQPVATGKIVIQN